MRVRAQTAAALRAMATEEPIEVVVAGDCMAPALAGGSRILVARRRLYLPGDVVAFRRADDRLLVHRLLGYTLNRQGLGFLAKGDRLAREDEPALLASVVGRVVACEGIEFRVPARRRGRALLQFLETLLRRLIRPWISANGS